MLLASVLGLLFVIGLTFADEQCHRRLQWTTAGGKIMVNGQPLVLKGINYFGFETETHAPHGMWDHNLNDMLDFIKNNGFNAIRVPISMELIRKNPFVDDIHCQKNHPLCHGEHDLTSHRLLNIFITRAADRGLLIMLDNHRNDAKGYTSPPLWYDNEYSEADVIGLWKSLVSQYKNQWNVFAIDLKNEPHDNATWGNSKPDTDWNKAAERMINSLHEFRGLFFVGGIEWGGRFEQAADYPIRANTPELNKRIVYSPHCYGPDVYMRKEFRAHDFPANLDAIYRAKYGFLAEKGHTVVIGEWGGHAAQGTRDWVWNDWYVNWMRSKCLTNNFYWCLNPNSDHTGGLLQDDWHTAHAHKLALVNRAQPNPTKFQARNNEICIRRGSFPEAKCNR